jgi:hypothetical protein
MEVEGLTPVMKHARNVLLMQYFLNGARVQEVLLLERKALKQVNIYSLISQKQMSSSLAKRRCA